MELKGGLIVKLESDEIPGIRKMLCVTAQTCLGIKYARDTTETHSQYWIGKPYMKNEKGVWALNFTIPPKSFDCSGLTKYVYGANMLYIPDGANGQWGYCQETRNPEPGDLAFAQTHGYRDHVGIYIGDGQILEARAPQENCSFKTGEVIIRPQEKWEKWERFAGYRRHPLL